jgi:hypothetical protein
MDAGHVESLGKVEAIIRLFRDFLRPDAVVMGKMKSGIEDLSPLNSDVVTARSAALDSTSPPIPVRAAVV